MPQGIYKEDITMISAGDFRNGLTIEYEGNVYQVIEFQHVKPGKGAAFVRTKLKNILLSIDYISKKNYFCALNRQPYGMA